MDKLLKKTLENISQKVKDNSDLYYINNGGCGYFASFVKHYLDNLGVNSEYVYIDDAVDTSEELIEIIKDSYSSSSARHVVLKVEDMFYDADGFSDNEDKYLEEYYGSMIIPFQMSPLMFYECAIFNKRGQWNWSWDYKRTNPILKKIITTEFEKYYNLVGKSEIINSTNKTFKEMS